MKVRRMRMGIHCLESQRLIVESNTTFSGSFVRGLKCCGARLTLNGMNCARRTRLMHCSAVTVLVTQHILAKPLLTRHTLAKATKSGMPVMGICLGHQLMGLASGLRTYKLRYGHRGGNQPVLDLHTRKVSITSQNHGFAVEDPVKGMLAPHPSGANSGEVECLTGCDVEVRFINANDRTVEGLDVKGRPAFTIQYHPEACPGPHDANPLFDRFSDLVAEHLEVKADAKTR